jgi:hypothetical protein
MQRLADCAKQIRGDVFQLAIRVPGNERRETERCLQELPAEIVDDANNPLAPPALGNGTAVSFGDFYALVPSPPVFAGGIFEQSDSLRLARAYRDRISQALIDRELGETLKASTGSDQKAYGATALGLLNDGWA